MTTINKYDANSIDIVEGLAHVRKRPSMYIGNTSEKGLHHLIFEILDNSIDEISNGFGDLIVVKRNKDNSITIKDNGRGVPIDIHPQKNIVAARVVFEILGSGGKFNNKNYKTSGGLHGVGAAVVNALSKWLTVEIKRDNYKYNIKYTTNNSEPILLEEKKESYNKKDTGTTVTFLPDQLIFKNRTFNNDTICDRLNELAYLNKNLNIKFIDENDNNFSYKHPNGIVEYLNDINKNYESINKNVLFFNGYYENIYIELAIQYIEED